MRYTTKCIDKVPRYVSWLRVHWQEDANAFLDILKPLGRIDLLVIDHYAIDFRWERQVRAQVDKILILDDLTDRSHEYDVLLDQSFQIDQDNRYNKLVPDNTQCLFGPQYALLRP